MRLIPREERFFHYFLEQVVLIQQAAQMLHKAAMQGNSSLREVAQAVIAIENKGDAIIHEIFTKLNQTFITPLDPEDIHSLGSHLDDVLDGIEDATFRLASYSIDPIPAPIVEMCEIIVKCSDALHRAFQALNDEKPVLEHCIEINRLEDIADQLVRRSIVEVFENEKDPITLIKLKEIYEFLEQTTDYCEDVADALQNVAVKNG